MKKSLNTILSSIYKKQQDEYKQLIKKHKEEIIKKVTTQFNEKIELLFHTISNNPKSKVNKDELMKLWNEHLNDENKSENKSENKNENKNENKSENKSENNKSQDGICRYIGKRGANKGKRCKKKIGKKYKFVCSIHKKYEIEFKDEEDEEDEEEEEEEEKDDKKEKKEEIKNFNSRRFERWNSKYPFFINKHFNILLKSKTNFTIFGKIILGNNEILPIDEKDKNIIKVYKCTNYNIEYMSKEELSKYIKEECLEDEENEEIQQQLDEDVNLSTDDEDDEEEDNVIGFENILKKVTN